MAWASDTTCSKGGKVVGDRAMVANAACVNH